MQCITSSSARFPIDLSFPGVSKNMAGMEDRMKRKRADNDSETREVFMIQQLNNIS